MWRQNSTHSKKPWHLIDLSGHFHALAFLRLLPGSRKLQSVFFFFVIRARSICPRCTAAYRLIVRPLSSLPPPPVKLNVPTYAARRLHVHTTREILAAKGGRRECWTVILPKCRLKRYIYGSFTCRKATTWDRRLYFPSKGRRAEDFFSPWKILTVSAGFEPANLGT
jgi:hypothetical protein